MKNLSRIIGAGMLLLTPLSTDNTIADTHVSYSKSTPNKTVRVEKNVEVYRTYHCCHDHITRRVDITKTRTTPYSNTTVTIHREGCSNHIHVAPAHVHVAPVQTYQTQTTTTTTTTTTTRTTTSPVRQIYYSLP
jgi:hypothetical protein